MKRIILGISGASGGVYAIGLLKALKANPKIETHLVVSQAAELCLAKESDIDLSQVKTLADHCHDNDDLAAPLASGSFKVDAMVVAPCSIKTLSAIANSFNHNLLIRAADVCLKEQRKLVLVPRETPLHAGHLELMLRVARLGAVILPPMPAFYHRPQSIQDIIDHSVGKILDQLGLEHQLFIPWGG